MKARLSSRRRFARILIIPAVAALACSGGDVPDEPVGLLQQRLTTVERVLGFEKVSSNASQSDWFFGPGSTGTISSSTTHTEGVTSLQIANVGWAQVQSVRVGPLGQVATTATLDLRVAGTGNLAWGDIILQADAPSQGIFNAQLGQVLLGGKTKATWHHLSVPLSQSFVSKLSASNLSDLSVRYTINLPAGSTVNLDKASFGQPPGGSGGTGGSSTGGASGSSGTSGTGGVAGAGSGGTSATGGGGGASGVGGTSGTGGSGASSGSNGSGGTAGSGGSGGTAGGKSVEFFFDLPAGVAKEAVALDAYGGTLTIGDSAKIITPTGAFSSASAVGSTLTTSVGANAQLQSLWSQPNVLLKTNAHLFGSLTTQGALTKQSGAVVDGTTSQLTSLDPLRRSSWVVTFPVTALPPQTITTATTFTPGSYGVTAIKPGGKLRLSPGTYTFKSLSLESGGTLDVDNTNDAVFLYSETTLGWAGSLTEHDATTNNILVGVAGQTPTTLASSFRGVLVAPQASVTLSSCAPAHSGAFFAKSFTLAPYGVVKHRPFDSISVCSAFECSGLCPCVSGSACKNDGDCDEGLVCGIGQGPRFGNAAGTNACWSPECPRDDSMRLCGGVGRPCGLCTMPPTLCTSDADCTVGDVCSPGNGGYFGIGGISVCWPSVCATAQRTQHCGTAKSTCGACDCSPTCASKTCGGDMSNGCGGDCAGICSDGQPGCTSDVQCTPGSVCIIGGGPRKGLAANVNVCLPEVCADPDVGRIPCGAQSAQCGLCPACQPDCSGKCGGAADGCGGTCTGSCGSGETCASGTCTGAFPVNSVQIPDGTGGMKDVQPLSPGPTVPVGATFGAFGVSDTGKATYRIPIAVAPGRLGVQPGLALAYNGTLRNGSLGVGWGLEGFSAISRCPHKFNREGFAAQSADDRTDRYCLDGDQLVAGPAQTYGADGAIHYPEFDPRTRVVSYGYGPRGPTYFKVWRSNGLIYSYGTTSHSSVYADTRTQLKREWALSRVEDHLGNYMTIDYLNIGPTNIERILKFGDFGTRELVPTRIQYTGFDGPNAAPLKPNRSVVLEYSPSRPDRNIAYTHDGHVTLRSRLLKKITSFVGDAMVREYNLLYGDETDQPARNGLSRLAYVQECEATVCKPLTHFEYNDDTTQELQPFEPAIHTGSFVAGHNSLSLLGGFVGATDFDGDGRDDAVYRTFEDIRGHTEKNCIESFGWTKVVDRWHLLRASAQGTLTPYPGLENFMQGFHTRCHPGTCGVRDFVHSSLDMASFTAESILDWNHDGAYDLLDIGVPRNASSLRYFAGSTGGSLTTTLVAPWPQYAPDCRWRGQELDDGRAEVVGDVDGDGNQDIVEAGVLVKRDPLNPSVTLAPVPRPVDPGAVPVDLDGDGVPELARRSLAEPDKLQVENFRADLGTTRRQLLPLSKGFPNIDLNGDGLRDVVRVEVPAKTESGQPELEAWLNIGSSFVQIPSLVLPESQDGYTPVIMDVDHDGHDDFLLPVARVLPAGSPTAAFNQWRVLTLEGSTFVELGTFDADLWPNDGVLGTKTVAKPVRSVKGDFDGDGNLDLAVLAQSDEVVLLRGRGVLNNLMRRITDGVGKRIDVSWRAGMNLEAARNCGPLRCETRTGPVVGQHAEAQVIPGSPSPRWERYFAYTYGDGRTNPADGKFLGFAKRTISEYDGNGLSTSGFIRATDVTIDNSVRASNGLYPLAGRRTHVKVTVLGATSSLMDGRQDQRITDTVFGWGICSGGQSGIVAWPCLKSKTVTVQDVIDSGSPQPVQSSLEVYTLDANGFGNVEHVSRYDSLTNAGASQLSTTDIHTPYRTDMLNDWLIALPLSQTVTDRMNHPGGTLIETRTTGFDFDAHGLLRSVTREPDNPYYFLATELERDNYGNVGGGAERSVASPATGEPARSRSFGIAYDSDQIYPTIIGDGLGHATYLDFDRRTGASTLVADANGIGSQWAYDGFGRPSRTVGPDTDSSTTYSRDSISTSEPIRTLGVMKATTVTTGYGTTEVSWDAFGRPVREAWTGLLAPTSDPTVMTETEYDLAGRVSKRSRPHLAGDASQGIIQYAYDMDRALSTITLADSSTIKFARASRANVSLEALGLNSLPDNYVWFSSVENPNRKTSIVARDHRGNLVASRDPAGKWISFNTGAFGTFNSVSTVDSTNNVLFDRYGRVTRTDDPDRGIERYLYTPWGELDGYLVGAQNTQIQKYHYDSVGRLDRVSSSREARDETYTYDDAGGLNEIGRLVSTTSHDGSRRDFTYEGPTAFLNRGFVKTVTDTVQSQTMTTAFDYNVAGQVRTVTYPGGSSPFQVEYAYDNGGNMKAVGSPGLSERYWELLDVDQGQRPKREGVGAMYTVKQYGALTGRMLGTQTYRAPDGAGGMALSLSYLFDPNGNLSYRTDFTHSPNDISEVFTPDSLDRLTNATANSAPSFHANYLPNGNIDTLSSISPAQFTYNNPGGQPLHAPDTAGGAQYTYNSSYPAGFRQTATGSGVVGSSQSTSYNSRQLPSRIDVGSANIAFEYHSSGERSRKARSDGSAVYYSGDFERSVASGGGSIEQKYRVFSPSGEVLEIVRGANDAELSRVYLHADHLGSPVAFTDQAGTVIHEQRFGPFGSVDNPSWQSQNPAVRRVTRGYTGHEHDPETGLVNMRARLYDARIARFTSPDPTVQAPGYSQSWNRYSYAWNNPFAWVDPSGLQNAEPVTIDDVLIMGELNPPGTPSDASSITGSDPLAEFFPADPPSDFPVVGSGVPLSPAPSRDQAWDAAKAGAWNWYVEQVKDAADLASTLAGPFGELARAAADSVAEDLKAPEPTDPSLLEQYEFMQRGLTAMQFALPVPGTGEAAAAKALPAVSRTARLTQQGVEHIALRHFPTSGATGAGKFATTSLRAVRSLISETIASGTIRPNTLGRPGTIFELNFGRQIGTNVAGDAATSLRVVVTPEGVVKTAFPF